MRQLGMWQFAAAVILLIPALLLIHNQEVSAVRREAAKWNALFEQDKPPEIMKYRVLLAVMDASPEPMGVLKRTVTRENDTAVMLTDFVPTTMLNISTGGVSFHQESVLRRDEGLIRLDGSATLAGRNIAIQAVREGDSYRISVQSDGKNWEKRVPVSALGAAGAGSVMSYFSPFDEHTDKMEPGAKLSSWELDPVTMQVKPVELVVGAPETITITKTEYQALPVKSRRFPPAVAWYSPEGILLREKIPLSTWTIVLERINSEDVK
jgi:hypothetical protein